MLEVQASRGRRAFVVPSPAGAVRRVLGLTVSRHVALVVWILVLASGAALTAFLPALLPARFTYDAAHIAQIAREGLAAGQGDRSFIAVGQVYNILRLQDSPPLVAGVSFLGLAVIHSAVLLQVPMRYGRMPAFVLLVLTTSLGLTIVYLTTYSKDAIVLLVTVAALLVVRRPTGDLVIVGALLLYALCFREYWFIVAGAYVAIRVVERSVPRRDAALLTPLVILLIVPVGYTLATGGSISEAREIVNALRAGSPDARTIIPHYLTLLEPWNSVANSVLTFVILVVPFPLLAIGGPYYLAIAVLILALWTAFGLSWIKRPQGEDGLAASRALSLVLAFLTAQSMFEPDYGSALRHLSPLLPLLALGVGLALSADHLNSLKRRGRHLA